MIRCGAMPCSTQRSSAFTRSWSASITGPLTVPLPNALGVTRVADRVGYLAVVVEPVLGGNRRVRPACVLDHLAAARPELAQIRIDRGDDGLEAETRFVVLLDHVDAEVVAVRRVLHQVAGEALAERVLRSGRRRRTARDPVDPAPGRRLAAGLEAGEQEDAVLVRAVVQLARRIDLRCRQAGGRILAAPALDVLGIETAF